MERSAVRPDARFRLDGGAPWLNLAATIGRAHSSAPQERLAEPGDLDAWLIAVGLAAPAATREDLKTAHRLRADCRELSEALIRRDAVAPELLRRFAEVAGRSSCTVMSTGVICWATTADALGVVAASALPFVSGPDRMALTQCQDPECAWVFLDPTRRRRWCSATTCGTRTRVRAHRARNRETAQPARRGTGP